MDGVIALKRWHALYLALALMAATMSLVGEKGHDGVLVTTRDKYSDGNIELALAEKAFGDSQQEPSFDEPDDSNPWALDETVQVERMDDLGMADDDAENASSVQLDAWAMLDDDRSLSVQDNAPVSTESALARAPVLTSTGARVLLADTSLIER